MEYILPLISLIGAVASAYFAYKARTAVSASATVPNAVEAPMAQTKGAGGGGRR